MKPTNDDFAAAETLTGGSGRTRSDTSLATRQTGEPRFQRRSIWYRWTAPRTGTAVFRTTGSLYDTTLSMYAGARLGSLRHPLGHAPRLRCRAAKRIAPYCEARPLSRRTHNPSWAYVQAHRLHTGTVPADERA